MKYDKSFKLEAISLSDEIGVRKTAEQPGIPYHTLYDWRKSRNRHSEQPFQEECLLEFTGRYMKESICH